MKRLFPFKPNERWSANFFLATIIVYLLWTAYVAFERKNNVEITPALATMLIPVFLVDGIKTLVESLTPKKSISGTEDLSKVTVIIPSYNGAAHIAATITDLLLRFPGNQIIISSNGSKDTTCDIGHKMGVLVMEIAEPIGKVEAINRALDMVETPYVLILDDDTLIGNAIIPTTALDDGHGGVAFRVLPIKNGFWSQMQLHEYRKSMDVGRKYHNRSATVQNISGAIGLFRVSELLRQTKIHTGEFSGEDLQRTLLVHLSRETSGGIVMSDSIVETLAPSDFITLFRQRVYGWYPGFLANFHLYAKLLTKRKIPLRLRIEAFYNTIVLALLDPIRLLSLPILLFNPVYLIFFYLVYVLLETVPYFTMGRNEPYWVILLFPIYGVFNFITRMLSMVVFFYRRLTKLIGRGLKNDDYKFVGNHAKGVGAVLSVLLGIVISLIYGGFLTAISNFESIYELPLPQQQTIKNSFVISEDLPESVEDRFTASPRLEFITLEVYSGDSRWSLSYQAVLRFSLINVIPLTLQELNRSSSFLVESFPEGSIHPGSSVRFDTDNIQLAINNAII